MTVAEALPGLLVVMALFGGIPFVTAIIVVYLVHSAERRSSAVVARRGLGSWALAVLAILAGVGLWFAWLSWGSYYARPCGHVEGPYRPWQVIGCALSVGAAVAALGWSARWRRSGPIVVATGVLAGFSTTWAVDAVRSDGTGLWGVGYLLLVVGGGAALGGVALAVIGVRAALAKKSTRPVYAEPS